jgi:hypothetical protein
MDAEVQQSQLECPEQLVRNIAQLVVKDEAPGDRLLCLVALCGVSKRWRQELCREVLLPVAFDGADNAGVPSRQATITRFRKADVGHKRATFLGASKLLAGGLPGFFGSHVCFQALLSACKCFRMTRSSAVAVYGPVLGEWSLKRREQFLRLQRSFLLRIMRSSYVL